MEKAHFWNSIKSNDFKAGINNSFYTRLQESRIQDQTEQQFFHEDWLKKKKIVVNGANVNRNVHSFRKWQKFRSKFTSRASWEEHIYKMILTQWRNEWYYEYNTIVIIHISPIFCLLDAGFSPTER